nr:flavodoxin [candidate division Zixibacteria bacterium]
MHKIGLFYGTTTGNTEEVARILAQELENVGLDVDMYDVADTDLQTMAHYDRMILVSPTWSRGSLPDDWETIYTDFAHLDFSGKRVAFLGLGDQVGYPDYFVDSIGKLARPVYLNGGQVVGQWPNKEYFFNRSDASEGDYFVGLAIDQDNEDFLTKDRIRAWVADLKKQFAD